MIKRCLCLLSVLLPVGLIAVSLLRAEPPAERTMVAAVAEEGTNRILVRWRTEEGSPRYVHHDVLRRLAGESAFVLLNAEPIGPLASAFDIETVFIAPGREDALASIRKSFGDDYANDILLLQSPDAPPEAQLQRRMLPEQNYGAALAMGLGLLDETTVLGETYVYEVWGLDELGFRLERLGRATATAGSPDVVEEPESLACVGMGGLPGNLVANLRWDESPSLQPFLGYDVLRVRADVAGSCPVDGGGDLVGAVVVNEFPVQRTFPGRVAEGQRRFEASCLACHAPPPGVDPRDETPIKRSTLRDFRRAQYADCTPPAGARGDHDTPELNALTHEELRAIYDYIQAFNFQDHGEAVPAEPLQAKDRFCYQVAARDLLGNPGRRSNKVVCGIPDRDPPAVPQLVKIDLAYEPTTQVESCSLSWRANDDDTARYFVYRASSVPRRACPVPAPLPSPPNPVPQGVPGSRITFADSMTAADAGWPFFYAVVAEDDAGWDEDGDGTPEENNRSGFSAWVPCTPRDRQAPAASTIDVTCELSNPSDPCSFTCPQCVDNATCPPTHWQNEGGAGLVIADPSAACPPVIEVTDAPDDTFRERTMLQLPGDAGFVSGADFDPDVAAEGRIDFGPLVDTRVCLGVRGFDRSGNLAPLSNTECLVLEGSAALPAPRVISYNVLDEVSGKVRIRFRSLEPEALVGFALYTGDAGTDPPMPPEKPGCLEDGFPPGNVGGGVHPELGPCPETVPERPWVILEGTRSLDQVLPWNDIGLEESLVYEGARIYELITHLGFTREVRLYLSAIGWSGREGWAVPFTGRMFQLAEGRLDWPEHRAENEPPPHPEEDDPFYPWTDQLEQVTPDSDGLGGFMRVVWRPQPRCTCDGEQRPFVVFRRRQGAQRWQQVSPLFNCPDTNCPGDPADQIDFFDRDVESGFFYQYTVVRLDEKAEFDFQHLPATAVCYPDAAACDGEAPE